MVRPCEENGRGAHSEKNARCGHTRENKKRAAKIKMKRCVSERYERGGFKYDNTTNRAVREEADRTLMTKPIGNEYLDMVIPLAFFSDITLPTRLSKEVEQ